MPPSSEALIFETPYWQVLLSRDQTYFGRCYIPLKRSCGDLALLTSEEVLDFHQYVVGPLEQIFRGAFNATMFNWSCLMNNAYQVPDPKPQVHWHFRPRFAQPVVLDGFHYKDPNFGHHYLSTDDTVLESALRQQVIATLQTHLHEK
jgi:diadenosine tetraphosphate (Ap4A) HIT family hydrolase